MNNSLDITEGSVVEVDGSVLLFESDFTPSSWSSITTSLSPFFAVTSPAGSAVWTVQEPVWRDDAQGWYASAASSTRYLGSVTKTGASSFSDKRLLLKTQAPYPIGLLE